jgi:excisionase family DNA binding protein
MAIQLSTISEISNFLNVRPKTIYSWVELGKIPCYKLNGCVRFDFAEITKWLDTCKQGPTYGTMDGAQTVAFAPKKGR